MARKSDLKSRFAVGIGLTASAGILFFLVLRCFQRQTTNDPGRRAVPTPQYGDSAVKGQTSSESMDRNRWLLLISLCYLASVVLYAFIYLMIFNRNPDNFTFSSQILPAQVSMFRKNAHAELIVLRRKNLLISEIKTQLIDQANPPRLIPGSLFSGPQVLTSKYRCRFRVITSGHVVAYSAIVEDQAGRSLDSFTVEGKGPDSLADWVSIFEARFKQNVDTVREIERKLNTIANEAPEVWSYWDFLYFSTITQTTVGYGDILPNSTLIRMIVTSQITLGTLLLAFGINLVFQGRRRSLREFPTASVTPPPSQPKS